MIKCDCKERIGIEIQAWDQFEELKAFFESQVERGIFSEIPVKKPYYTGYGNFHTSEWYADKWYRCNVCKTLWEMKYPDFPAHGFVHKFPRGKHKGRRVL